MIIGRALRSAPRIALGLATLGLGGWVLANTAQYRQVEAWSTARLVEATVGRGTHHVPGSSTFFVALETGHGVGLRIDQMCSSGLVAALMLVITGTLMVVARLQARRALLGVSAMVGLVAAVNAVRLTVLSWSVSRWGLAGWFEWLHLYGGAAISMVAISLGLALYLRLIRRIGPEAVA